MENGLEKLYKNGFEKRYQNGIQKALKRGVRGYRLFRAQEAQIRAQRARDNIWGSEDLVFCGPLEKLWKNYWKTIKKRSGSFRLALRGWALQVLAHDLGHQAGHKRNKKLSKNMLEKL